MKIKTKQFRCFRRLMVAPAVLTLAITAVQVAQADTFFWTDISGGNINKTTTPGPTTTNVASGLTAPDSLIFNATGTQIIYTSLTGADAGVWTVNTSGTGNTQIATKTQLGGSNFVQDLALEPGGNSVLVSATDTGQLFRIDLITNTVSLVATLGGGLRGITYDNAGNLFAVVTGNVVAQVNPITGAVINSIPIGGFADGITFDPFTGNLFVAQGNVVSELPTSLATITDFTCGVCTFIDGLESDGSGNIDLADANAGNIAQYNIPGNTFSVAASTPGIDDLAPVTGLGAPPVPEPTSLILLGSVVSLISLKFRKRFAR